MLVFIIPVKSAQVSGSWGNFSKLFERTLKSVSNQTSNNFKIVVVCHEKPETNFTHKNLEFIQISFSPPKLHPSDNEKNNAMKEEDKSKKILAGAEHAKKYNPDYVMVVDADDCISNKIVAFVDKNMGEKEVGWHFNKGYLYREGDKFITLNKKNFNTLCGTCIIVKPAYIEDIFINKTHLLYVHKTTKLKNGASLKPLPIPGAIYSVGNGENHFMSANKMVSLNKGSIFSLKTIKGIIRKIKKYRFKRLSTSIKAEFGIYNLNIN